MEKDHHNSDTLVEDSNREVIVEIVEGEKVFYQDILPL